MENNLLIHPDCRHFKGDIPCNPHKDFGVHCDGCTYYDPVSQRILIIKLGAIGDVIRTTALLPKLWNEFPKAEIWWLTLTPDVVPSRVDKILSFNPATLLLIQQTDFDIVYNLDKDREACALTNCVKAEKKFGFCLKNGKPAPVNDLARHKFLTGLFDDISLANTKNYQQEIYEICGFEYHNEDYVLDVRAKIKTWNIDHSKKVIGLNTGCGGRWTSRLWKTENWILLTEKLIANNYEVILLGGEQEHVRNAAIAEKNKARYFGYFSLKEFISLMNECDLIVTGVTMAMHFAIGLKKKLILFNNIFNPHEFVLYGRGEIVQPQKICRCFYKSLCTESLHCMETLTPEHVFALCKKWLPSN